jgi:hypothetical protein
VEVEEDRPPLALLVVPDVVLLLIRRLVVVKAVGPRMKRPALQRRKPRPPLRPVAARPAADGGVRQWPWIPPGDAAAAAQS